MWALSRHICCHLRSNLLAMTEKENASETIQNTHKEEGKANMKSDEKDRRDTSAARTMPEPTQQE